MNRYQSTIIGVGIALIAAMALFPPWYTVDVARGITLGASPSGYSFIGSPPQGVIVQIDSTRLAVQFVAVVTIIGGLVAIAGGRGRDGWA